MNSSMVSFGYFPGKSLLKGIRWEFRRFVKRSQYGAEAFNHAPIIFGNAMPKSGSHLLTQVLEGVTELGPFVNPGYPPVNRSEDNRPINPEKVVKKLHEMRPGDFRYGYIHAVEPYTSILTQPNWATFFIYRDPRDMLVSHVFYATELNEKHGMHHYYTEKLSSMKDRLNAAIRGVTESGSELGSVTQRYQSYIGWLERPEVHCMKFEELVLNQESTLRQLLDFLEQRGGRINRRSEEAIQIIRRHIDPKKSGTYRKGVPGGWREYFTEENLAVFNREAGDLLQRLGYEQDS